MLKVGNIAQASYRYRFTLSSILIATFVPLGIAQFTGRLYSRGIWVPSSPLPYHLEWVQAGWLLLCTTLGVIGYRREPTQTGAGVAISWAVLLYGMAHMD